MLDYIRHSIVLKCVSQLTNVTRVLQRAAAGIGSACGLGAAQHAAGPPGGATGRLGTEMWGSVIAWGSTAAPQTTSEEERTGPATTNKSRSSQSVAGNANAGRRQARQ
jgi:hypothetical protein